MRNKIIYLLSGLLISLGLYFTRIKSIDNETLELINQAMLIESNDFFDGYDISSYPVDVHYGKIEYRYKDGDIQEKKPDTVPAFTAFPSENGPVLKLMPVHDLKNIIDFGGMSPKEAKATFLSVILHEGFHCYQMDNGLKTDSIKANGSIDTDNQEYKDLITFGKIMTRLDSDEKYQDLWLKEMQALLAYRDQGKKDDYIKAKNNKMDYVEGKLGKKDYKIYDYYVKEKELLEGTAKFIENQVLNKYGFENKKKNFKNYESGQGQYYTSGAMKAEILEKHGQLKDLRFDMSTNLDDLLGV